MERGITGSAKAETPFGPMTGRTRVEIEPSGEDMVVITFHCGATPVILAMAGGNFHAFIRACIGQASEMTRRKYTKQLDEVVA